MIPTHDRVDLLSRAITSVLEQTVADLEVVVVDDGPTAAIADLVRAHPDPRVRLIRHSHNRGVAAARNTGLAAARSPFIGFLDDDDIWLPAKLERQLEVIERLGADIVHTLVYVTDIQGNVFANASERGFRLFQEVAAAGYPYKLLLRRSSFFLNTFVVRRECFDVVGGFDEELATVDDLDIVHRLRRRFPLHLVPEPLVKHCFHPDNQSSSLNPQLWIRLAEKEFKWLETANPPEREKIEAYLHMQVAQSAWIASRYRDTVRPALRARRLDPSVIRLRTIAKDLVAAALPSRLVNLARLWVRARRPPSEPDPWLEL